MLKKNEVIELNIDDLTVDGAGIGRYDGQIVFVQKALPSECIETKIIKAKKNYAIGLLQRILKSSSERVDPFCPVFGKCGGCSLQHLSYIDQLNYKSNYVQQCLKRIGGIDIKRPEIIPSDNEKEYRNKASFPVAQINGEIVAGFYAHHTHRVIPSYCAVQHSQINKVKDIVVDWAKEKGISAYDEKTGKGSLRHIVVRRSSIGEIMTGIVSTERIIDDELIERLTAVKGMSSIIENINSSKGNNILGSKSTPVYGSGYINEKYGDVKFKASLNSFLQINHVQTEKLYEIALEFADVKQTDTVFDLFCGIGTISLLAAKKAKSVVGIEYVQQAVDNAIENAELNGITNASFLAGDAGEKLDEAIELVGRPDVVILDPPRKGCDEALVKKLCELKPSRIVYVSCSPSTLARDVALLKEGGYVLEEIKAVDMFPQTTHVETVISLRRKYMRYNIKVD